MKTILSSVALLAMSVTGASAAMILQETPNDEWVWVDTSSQAQHRVQMGESGQRPGDCPAGTYFLGKDPVSGSKQVVMSCDDNSKIYGLTRPTPDTKMPSGEPYPEGTFLLSEDNDNWNVKTDEMLN